MPVVEINISNNFTTRRTFPFSIPFTIHLPDRDHASCPIYFKKVCMRWPLPATDSSVSLPTTISISFTNLNHDTAHSIITFPLKRSFQAFPCSLHHITDQHIGDISNQQIVNGLITFTGSTSVTYPTTISIPQSMTIQVLVDNMDL